MTKTENNSFRSVNLLDMIITLFRYKKRVIIIVGSITILALLISLVWPKEYKSSIRFVQYGVSNPGSLGNLVGNFMQMSVNADRVSSEQSLIILRSRTMLDEIIDEFNLHDVYKNDVREFVREELANNTIIEEVREGGIGFNPIVSVEISVFAKEPELSKEIAEYYYNELERRMIEINKKNSQAVFNMLNNRLMENLQDLKEAEEKFAEFQKKHGIMQLEPQVESMIENLATLKAQMVELNIELNVTKAMMQNRSSKVKELELKKTELNNVYNGLIKRTEGKAESGELFEEIPESQEIFPPLLNVPDLGIQYMRLFRELKIQEQIYELVFPQYEQQRMMATNIQSGLEQIDTPQVPTYKDKPSRALITIAGFIFSLFVAFFSVQFSEFKRKGEEENMENYQKYLKLKKLLFSGSN
jgi:tyrosine-protein kinase Etk/Wzc